MEGQPRTKVAEWQRLTPEHVANLAVRAGVRRMIVLDLAAVGVDGGPTTLALGRAFRDLWPELELIGGGGVRDARDLALLEAAGYDAALVASALHDGRLLSPDLPSHS
jgi:uncharacterized protein related to proFAR isomerase